MGLFNVAKNYTLGHASYGKNIGKSREKGEGPLFYRGRREFGRALVNRSLGVKS